jgi:hypothetical protein
VSVPDPSAPDPGGAFASDVHRRVQSNLPNPDQDPQTVEELLAGRIANDDYLEVDEDELLDALKDLEADGHATETKQGWKNTKSGFTLLTAPPSEEP